MLDIRNAYHRILYLTNTTGLRGCWVKHYKTFLLVSILLMLPIAFLRLNFEFQRLLTNSGVDGVSDLALRYEESHQWFAGNPVYGEIEHAVYPPASYIILWPFLGWLSLTEAEWVFAFSSILMIVWLAYLIVRESKAETQIERTFLLLLLLSMYATSVTIGNGQLILHVLPTLLAGLFLLNRKAGWGQDLLGAGLIVLTLVSPTNAAPFFWIVLFVPDRIRPAVLVLLGYFGLTMVATLFQETSTVSLMWSWWEQSQGGVEHGAVQGGYGNLHSWLTTFGLQSWNFPASLLVLGGLGVWVYRYRHVNIWLLLGVSAIIARIWTYHRLYDDLLILLPIIALFQIIKQSQIEHQHNVVALGLFVIAWFAVLSPARLLSFHPPWNWLMMSVQIGTWSLILIFLIYETRKEEIRASSSLSSKVSAVSS